MVARCLDNFAHPFGPTNIARIDAQTGRPGLRRLDRALIMEMDIGDDRHGDIIDDRLQRRRRILVRAGHAHDIGAGLFKRMNLPDCRLRPTGTSPTMMRRALRR
jgi:hypothetical protein